MTYCDSCGLEKPTTEYLINGFNVWHCDDCAVMEVRGYFSYDCQEDGYCTFGCGKRPKTVCAVCVQDHVWLEGQPVPDNWHAMRVPEESDYIDVCDLCDEPF